MNNNVNDYQIGDRLFFKPDDTNPYRCSVTFIKYKYKHLEYFKNTPFNFDDMHNVEEGLLKIYLTIETKDTISSIYIYDIYPEVNRNNVDKIVICVEFNDEKYYCLIRNYAYVKDRFKVDMIYRRCNNIDKLLNL